MTSDRGGGLLALRDRRFNLGYYPLGQIRQKIPREEGVKVSLRILSAFLVFL